MTSTEIQTNLTLIRTALDLHVGEGDPGGMMEKINKLSSLMGLSAECYANAEYNYNRRMLEAMNDYKDRDYNTTEKKYMITGECAKEIQLMTLAEHYSKKMDKVIEGLRSTLSFLKEELNQTGR